MSEVKVEDEAVEHLLRVTSGFRFNRTWRNSNFRSNRDAFFLAQSTGTTGTIFNHLFKQAITFAKRAHNETDIADNAVSVSYAAVELSEKSIWQIEK